MHAAMEALPRLKLSIRHTEEGMVGCTPNRPTEDPGLLLLLAHSLSRTFRDQSPTHNKKGATERGKRKDDSQEPMWFYGTLALLVSTENSQRDFLENVCKTSTPNQAGTSSRCQMEHLPTSDSMLDVVAGKWCAAFDTLKREHFSQRNNWSGHSPRFHSLHKTIGYTLFFCWPAQLFNLSENGPSSRAQHVRSYTEREETTQTS